VSVVFVEDKKKSTSLQLLKHLSLWLKVYWYACVLFSTTTNFTVTGVQ